MLGARSLSFALTVIVFLFDRLYPEGLRAVAVSIGTEERPGSVEQGGG